ncbi:WD40 repeat-like protein [Venturia nashicola]|nr:WD40 repeat-like protein [Venturia nashicola]
MSLATPVKDGKRKRKSVDTPSQSQDSKRLKSQDAEPTPESSSHLTAKKTSATRQPFSNSSLPKDIQKKLAMESTEKPFPNPKNQGQTCTNQAWRKQNKYRKMQARTQAKKEKSDASPFEEEDKVEAAEDAGEKKPRKETELKADKRKKKTNNDDKVDSENPIAAEVVNQEIVPVEPLKEVVVKKAKELEENKRPNKPQKNIVTKKKEKKSKKSKSERQEIVNVEADLFPRGLTAERTVANRGNWASSKPVGGHFITHDPVFSTDEKFLFLATPRCVQVYSASESRLVRALPIESVVTYTLSVSNPNLLYAVSSQEIVLFDWTTGKEVKRSASVLPISAIAIARITETKQDTLFAIQREESEECLRDHITVQNISSPAVRLFFVSMQTLKYLKVLGNGRTIIAASETQLCIGTLNGAALNASTELSDLPSRYVWRTLKSVEPVTCLDAQVRTASSPGSSKKQRLIVDLVFGNLKGEIIVYEDIVHKLEENEKLKGKDVALKPIVTHWHREAPATVKWSLDGNYVISGGKETVLCLLQRETSKRQLLPHLTSPIESLSVSPSGTSYAVQLSDNSAMVLSTSELQPKTNIAGLQSRFVPSSQSAVALHTHNPLDSFVRTPAVANPRNPKQLIMAVPTSQIQTDSITTSAPFLQVFDVHVSRHVSRQALTRNMVTNINVGPEGNKVREPNVTLLQVSFDGQWLATVEEWTPPTADVAHMAREDNVLDQETRRKREVYLKFWRWNDEEEGFWALDTRIDLPHQSSVGPHANRIFDLVSNPAEVGFATVGEDSIVRVWRPKTKLADGRIVRGARDGVVTTWTCSHETVLDSTALPLEYEPAFTNGKLAFSNDGSILAATQQNADPATANTIHFLNASNGTIRSSESAFHVSHLLGMGFINRYFITLSDELRVWDLVANKLVYGFQLDVPSFSPKHKENISFLSINSKSNTFAIAIPTKPGHIIPGLRALETISLVGISTSVLVFDPRELAPLFAIEVPGVVSALVDVHGSAGFFVLDAQAEVRVIAPKISAFVAEKSEIVDVDVVASDEAEVEDEEEEEAEDGEETVTRIEDSVMEGGEDLLDGDKHVVAPEKLAGLFNGDQSFAMPSVKDLFYGVVGLYARHKDDGTAL